MQRYRYARIESLLSRVFGGIAAIVLFGLMTLTCADVIGRYALDAPLIGAFELTQLGLAIIIFSVLPIVTGRSEHVTVDIIDMVVGRAVRLVLRIFADFISLGILCLMGVVLWERADMIAASGLHTESLFIPMAPVAYFMAVATFCAAFAIGGSLVMRLVAVQADDRDDDRV